MISVYLRWVVFVGTVVTAVANIILIKVKLARIVKEGTVVLWSKFNWEIIISDLN